MALSDSTAAPAGPANWHQENGFEFALFPAQTEKPECLIIYLHGVGDNAGNRENMAAALQKKLPGADVISLQAPLKFEHPELPPDHKGYTWFPYGGPVLPQVKTGLSHVFNRAPIVGQVEAFAHAQLEKRGLGEENLSYIGNSMGAIVALQVGLSGKTPVASIVSRAGSVPPFTSVKSKPGIFLQMGEADTIFNAEPPRQKGLKGVFARVADRLSLRHGRTIERLQKKNVEFTAKIYSGQGHMLDAETFKDSVDFIEKTLKRKPPTAG